MSRGALAWLRSHVPSRDDLSRNRWVKPFASTVLRSDLWVFNRRSVPRGVALGLFVGVMIPLAHFAVAAFVAVFVRANIPAALAATFIGFPLIYVVIVAAAYKIGELILHLDAMTTLTPIAETMQQTQTDNLLQRLTGAGLDTAFGLLVIATALAALGYMITSFVWRHLVARKRKRRLAEARQREPAG